MSGAHLRAIRRDGPRPFAPPQSEFTSEFWNGLRGRKLLASQCNTCARLSFPPKPFCPHCWCPSVSWKSLSGRGVVYSATVVHAAPRIFRALAPYSVCIVDLDENLRIATQLLGLSSVATAIDRRVEIVVVDYDDGSLFAAQFLENMTKSAQK